jgi:TonB-dependent starch-binding outer membrane protein SusC
MRKSIGILGLFLLGVALPAFVFAQTNISGIVVSSSGNPLQGASVILSGTNKSTQTDAEGKFSIMVSGVKPRLTISYVGYITTTVDAKNNMEIQMLEDVSKLSEVIITGLATSVKRSNLANAVASISSQELVGTTPQSTMDAALYGKFTGANISANSGAPGGGISVKLRGITSLVASSQPLFIVDNVFYDNSAIAAGLNTVSKAAGQGSVANQDNPSNRIADLDPEDIERIEILKGASAAAIYGSRAAAGVVIITTKKGKSGKPKIELSHSIGVQEQLRKLGQRSWDATKALAAFGPTGQAIFNAANGRTFNYEDELYGNKGLMNTTRISVSGGSNKTSYFVGVTRKNDEGIVKGTGYEKTSFRINLDQEIVNNLDLSVNMNYVESEANRGYFNNDNTSTTLGVSFVSTPSWVNLFPDANGNYPNNPLVPSNILQTRDLVTNKEKISRTLMGGVVTWKAFNSEKHDLKFLARAGSDNYSLNTIAIFPRELQFQKDGNGTNGVSVYGTTLTKNYNMAAFAIYTFKPSYKYEFRTQVGATQENINLNNVLNTATQLIGTQTNVNQAGSIIADQARTLQKDKGFFVQEEFNYDDIVIATLGLRGDKSSRNGDADKLYYYPKASVAFNIHQLPNMNLGVINQLKIRSAYGQAGNFPPFGAIYSPLVPQVFRGNTGSLIGLTRGNELLEPERQKELEIGLDVGVLKNRVGLEITYYKKDVDDLLLQVVIPTSSGFSTAWNNVATIENKGIEVGLNATPIKTNNVTWKSQVNFWRNTALVTELKVPAFNTGAFGATLGTYRIEQGKSPTQLVGRAGPNDKADPVSGLATFGNAEPDFQMSYNNTVSYKKLELSVLMHWKQGGENINLTTLLSDIFGTSPDYDVKSKDPTGALNNGDYRLSQLGVSARTWIENASYFRVREIGLSYSLPKDWFKNIASVKVGFSGRNLINSFKYNSYDPEVSNFGANAISSNVEVTPFPSSKSYHFNISVGF